VHRIVVTLSDDEYAALHRAADARRVSIAELVRAAIDAAHGTDHEEIPRPGRKPWKEKDG
jgi:hypothetical protein